MKKQFDIPLSLSLFILLLQHRGVKFSAEAIANILQCSVRSVYRHVDILTIAGVPVQKRKGRSGGVFGWSNLINSIKFRGKKL